VPIDNTHGTYSKPAEDWNEAHAHCPGTAVEEQSQACTNAVLNIQHPRGRMRSILTSSVPSEYSSSFMLLRPSFSMSLIWLGTCLVSSASSMFRFDRCEFPAGRRSENLRDAHTTYSQRRVLCEHRLGSGHRFPHDCHAATVNGVQRSIRLSPSPHGFSGDG
jgi:hypothetical protein